MRMTVFFLGKRCSTDTCLCFLGNTCLCFHLLTKVVTNFVIHDHLPLHLSKHLPLWAHNNLPLGFLLTKDGRPSAVILMLKKLMHAEGYIISGLTGLLLHHTDVLHRCITRSFL